MAAITRSRLTVLVGLLAFIAALVAISLIYKTDSTPPWRLPKTTQQKETAPSPKQDTSPKGGLPFNFVSYNVQNWLISSQNPEKTAESKTALIQILADCEPSVIGLIEIGSVADVEEIRTLLQKEGAKYPYFHHTGGADGVRHLAILSKFEITATAQPDLAIPGTNYSMQRGILDVTLDVGGQEMRFVGLHLKSKRSVPEFDQSLIRLDEANHVRRHIDAILEAKPETKLVVYGDFNDTPRSLSTKAILGTYRTPGYLTPLHLKDSRGESWTHFWDYQDLYSRIDYITISKALSRNIDRKRSRIVDFPDWKTASDHRPILVRFK